MGGIDIYIYICVGELASRSRAHCMWVVGPFTFCIHRGAHTTLQNSDIL